MEKYRDQCRARFTEEYENVDVPISSSIGQKRPHSVFEDEDAIDSDEEYEKLRQSVNSQPFNEFDNYIQLPRIERKIRTLDW